jgi:hypothetical protein
MSDPNPADAQMTPDTRMMIRRARGAFLLSIGLLLVGLVAVGVAIVYKSSEGGPAPASSGADYSLAAVKVPSGAEVISAVAADGKLTVTYRSGSATSIRIFDGRSGDLLREVPVTGE